MNRKVKSSGEKNKHEQMIDAILGSDEEMSNESATEILGLYGLTDNDLIDSFKASMSKRLQELPADSDDAKSLGGLLRNVRDYQKGLTGERLTPKERIAKLLDGLITPPTAVSYAFRERKDGELPDSDKQILDDLKRELLDGSKGNK
ncbi:MAG: hypothetical protein IPM59_09550 [Chloracidobacterium sp.]|nr:hypothetical protein [Chloracidobacterium sp.]